MTVILATDMAEYMGLIIALHMLTGAAGSGGCICLDRRGPLGVAFRQTGPFFCEGCRAAVALSFVVELWLVRPPLWEAALPRLPEGGAVVAAAVVGAATKPHALLLHSHLTHGMDRKTHMWQTLANLLGGLRHKHFNSNHGDSGPLRESGGSGGGAGGPRASVRRLGRSPLLRGVSQSLRCMCSATPRAEGFRPLRRGSPPASSTSPRRSPHFTSAPAPGLHAVRAVAGPAGGHGGGAVELAYGGDSGEGGRPGGRSLRNGDGPILLRRRLEPPASSSRPR